MEYIHFLWPGNVRELENAVEHAFVMCQNDTIAAEHLPSRIRKQNNLVDIQPRLTLKACEKKSILEALERNQWKRVKTAKELGIDKNTLRRKIIRHAIAEP